MRLVLVALLSAVTFAQTGCIVQENTSRRRCTDRDNVRVTTITVPTDYDVVEYCIEEAATLGHLYFSARTNQRLCDIPEPGQDAEDLCVTNADSANNNWRVYELSCEDEARYGSEYCADPAPYAWFEQGRGGMCCSEEPTNDGDVCPGFTSFCVSDAGLTIGQECENASDKPQGTAMCAEEAPNAFTFYATREDMCCSVEPTGTGHQQDCAQAFQSCLNRNGRGETCLDYDPDATTTTAEPELTSENLLLLVGIVGVDESNKDATCEVFADALDATIISCDIDPIPDDEVDLQIGLVVDDVWASVDTATALGFLESLTYPAGVSLGNSDWIQAIGYYTPPRSLRDEVTRLLERRDNKRVRQRLRAALAAIELDYIDNYILAPWYRNSERFIYQMKQILKKSGRGRIRLWSRLQRRWSLFEYTVRH